MKNVKVMIDYNEDGSDRNPQYADVNLTTPITQEITDLIRDTEGVDCASSGPSSILGRYSCYFTCGKAFDKHQVANNVRMALAEHFAESAANHDS